MQRDENVRGLEVAVDYPLLMRVLDRLANPDEKIEPFLGGEIGLVAVVRDANAPCQFHHEVRPAGNAGFPTGLSVRSCQCLLADWKVGATWIGFAGHPGIEHLGDVRL